MHEPLIKMVAYQAESDLLRLVAPHYRRAGQEGRTLLQSALASTAGLEVTRTELRITLVAQSSPHRTRAIAALSLGAWLDPCHGQKQRPPCPNAEGS
jgi:hypothetical protein